VVDLASIVGADAPAPPGPGVFSPDQMRRIRTLLARSPYYVDDNAFLRVSVSNTLTGVIVAVHFRMSTPAGEVKASRLTITPTSDASVTMQDFALAEGLLFNVTAFASAGAPVLGQTFVRVQLLQGSGTPATILATLVADYVTTNQGPGYPASPVRTSLDSGGYERVVLGTMPGAGLNIAETVPTGRRWQILNIFAGFSTNATPAGRYTQCAIGDPVGTKIFAPCPTAQPASSGWFYAFGAGAATLLDAITGRFQVGLPVTVLALDTATIALQAQFIQAGDQWSAPVLSVREWLQVL
jgi:hypothetical protein